MKCFQLILAHLLLAIAHCQLSSDATLSYFGGSNNGAYQSWLDAAASDYTNSLFLESAVDDSQGVAVHWRLDRSAERIYLAVASRTTGWVGFGISENGGMLGADILLFEATRPDTLIDSYNLEDRGPLSDDNQDWNLTSSATDGGFLIFEANRAFDTGDGQDRVIIPDAEMAVPEARIIGAWGEEPNVGYHGDNRVRGSVRWFRDDGDVDSVQEFAQQMEESAMGFFDLRANNYPIKARNTEYVTFCFSQDDILAQDVPQVARSYVVGFEAIVDSRASRHIHHFTLYGSPEATFTGSCEDADFTELAYVWAFGAEPYALPPNVGAPLGLNGGFRSFQLEIHYDNAALVQGVIDSSGVRLYYTTDEKEFEAGILQLGDPDVNLYGQSVGNDLVEHTFACPDSCSTSILGDKKVTILREYLHMHQTGIRMSNELVRNGSVVHTGHVDFFDFSQQGAQTVRQSPYVVEPGDSFKTTCQYRSRSGQEIFGLSSEEEMCIAYLSYYPRQLGFDTAGWICGLDIGGPACNADWEMTELGSVDSLGRMFGVASSAPDIDGSDTTDGSESSTAPSPSPVADSGTALTVTSILFTTAFLFWLPISV